ncbi:MAG: rhodanese-like domain-containing protein [Duodenibacillus sp.]|nr:rhodanese-like domain-containing protein [Duodenibacillus sp.]
MQVKFAQLALCSSLLFSAAAFAGSDTDIVEAPVYDQMPDRISCVEAEELLRQKVRFYDCNTMEIWGEGFIPGSIFFNVENWKELLPAKKDTPMVFYCVNELCTSSETAAREVMKLGYTQVYQMPQGIYGWKISGRKFERP